MKRAELSWRIACQSTDRGGTSRSLLGTFDTAEAAYVEGVHRFGNTPFLIKEILPEEPVAHLPALSLGLLRAHP